MSEKSRILLHLDTDAAPSVFDRVVAVDAGVDHLFSYGAVTPTSVTPIVHGAIFTRGTKDLHRTAIFIGGSEVAAGEALFKAVQTAMLPQFGLSVSMLLDSNGCNTTACAAVACAAKHLDLSQARSLVLGGTGPVGQRAARLLTRLGSRVAIGSRQKEKAEQVARQIREAVPGSQVEAVAVLSTADAPAALAGRQLVIAAGAAGTLLLPLKLRQSATDLRVAIDLNGVPPAGIEGIELTDHATPRDGVVAYGALGVGGLKMKLHKLAIQQLFTQSQLRLDLEAIYGLIPSLTTPTGTQQPIQTPGGRILSFGRKISPQRSPQIPANES